VRIMRCGHSRNNSDYDYCFSRAVGTKRQTEKKTVVVIFYSSKRNGWYKISFRGRRAVTTKKVYEGVHNIFIYVVRHVKRTGSVTVKKKKKNRQNSLSLHRIYDYCMALIKVLKFWRPVL